MGRDKYRWLMSVWGLYRPSIDNIAY
jgi:hypothetical protein